MLQTLPKYLLAPLPLPLLAPYLQKLAKRLARQRPEFFERLGSCRMTKYLIDPVNLPFVFILCPNPEKISLKACRRSKIPPHDASISGTFLVLLDMLDGRQDGDALFFSRDIVINGDIEAVTVLRNALDDLDGSIVDDVIAPFGRAGSAALSLTRKIRTHNEKKQSS